MQKYDISNKIEKILFSKKPASYIWPHKYGICSSIFCRLCMYLAKRCSESTRFTLLTILTRKDWCFTQFSTGMAGWLLLIFFICLHNQLSSIHSIIRCLKNVIHQIDSKNGWLLLSASLRQNLDFLRGFIFKPTERA